MTYSNEMKIIIERAREWDVAMLELYGHSPISTPTDNDIIEFAKRCENGVVETTPFVDF